MFISTYRHLLEIIEENRGVALNIFVGLLLTQVIAMFGGRPTLQGGLLLLLVFWLWLAASALGHGYTRRVRKTDPQWADMLTLFVGLLTLLQLFMLTRYAVSLVEAQQMRYAVPASELFVFTLLFIFFVVTLQQTFKGAVENAESLNSLLGPPPSPPVDAL